MTPHRRIRALAPVLLAGALALTLVAAPAQAATASPQKSCFLLDCLFPTPTPTPTTPTQAPSPAPSTPGLTLPTALPTWPGTGSGSGSGTASGGTTAPSTPADAGSCQTSAFPSTSATSNSAKLDYASAMQACSKAVAAGDAVAPDDTTTTSTPEISNDLSTIKASKLTMTGLAYNGIATLQSPAGPVKALAFSADEVDLENMDQTYPFAGGQAEIAGGAQTAVLKGNVRLYVTKMASNIFGLIPLTFTPSFPPPLVLSSMFFTDADTDVALVQCDQILLPTLKLPVTSR